MRIYIVDDEELACRGLAYMIRSIFNQSPEEIYCFTSPLEALSKAKDFPPDIILLDITMEEMNGLEFITQVRKYVSPRIVIISGNDAYSFVRECFKMNVEDYLLKPIEYSELENLMLRLSNLEDRVNNDTELSNQRDYEYGFAIILKLSFDRDDLNRKIIDIPQKIGLQDYVSVLTYDEAYMNTVHIFSLREKENYDFCIKELKNIFVNRNKPGVPPCKAAYSSLVNMDNINNALTEAKQAFKNRIYDEMTNCYGADETESLPLSDDNAFEQELITLTPYLSQKDTEIYNRFITKWFNKATLREISYDNIKNRYEHFESKLLREIMPYNGNIKVKSFDEFTTINEMVANICQLLTTISEFMDKNRFEVDIMSEALGYINDNFNKDINLSFISNKFNLSYSYFSRIFKMYAGVSFTQYLLKVRMEKAKELLISSPNLKIKEVASMVGYDYDNVQNFTRAFKNYFGKSPQYYKD